MSWHDFKCENPDFIVRSIPDNCEIGVRKSCLEGSEVLKDMFAVCEPGAVQDDQKLDLYETTSELSALFGVLHNPPKPPTVLSEVLNPAEYHKVGHLKQYDSSTVIPFPLLPLLISLADKYALSEEFTKSLDAHLLANVAVYPLRVYGFATWNGMNEIASDASAYLLHPPVASYTMEEIKVIPTVEDYHKLVVLQDYRVTRLREVLLGEEIFPHGYGACSAHNKQTNSLWEQAKQALGVKLGAATDVAAEMSVMQSEVKSCKVCNKAYAAAVDMLAYKCRKIPRKIAHLSTTEDVKRSTARQEQLGYMRH